MALKRQPTTLAQFYEAGRKKGLTDDQIADEADRWRRQFGSLFSDDPEMTEADIQSKHRQPRITAPRQAAVSETTKVAGVPPQAQDGEFQPPIPAQRQAGGASPYEAYSAMAERQAERERYPFGKTQTLAEKHIKDRTLAEIAAAPERTIRAGRTAIETVIDPYLTTAGVVAGAAPEFLKQTGAQTLAGIGKIIPKTWKTAGKKTLEQISKFSKAHPELAEDIGAASYFAPTPPVAGALKGIASGGLLRTVGAGSREFGKKMLGGELKIKQALAKRGYGKNLPEQKRNIINTIDQYGLVSPSGDFRTASNKADEIITAFDSRAKQIASELSASGSEKVLKYTDAGKIIEDTWREYQATLGKIDQADAVFRKILVDAEKKDMLGLRPLDRIIEFKQLLKEGEKTFSKGVIPSPADAMENDIRKRIYLKTVEKIGGISDELKRLGKEEKKLIDAKAIIDDANARIMNKEFGLSWSDKLLAFSTALGVLGGQVSGHGGLSVGAVAAGGALYGLGKAGAQGRAPALFMRGGKFLEEKAPVISRTAAGAGAGGFVGSTIGDTPEERQKNAFLGFAFGALGVNVRPLVRELQSLGETGAITIAKIDVAKKIGAFPPQLQAIADDMQIISKIDNDLWKIHRPFSRKYGTIALNNINTYNAILSRYPEIKKKLLVIQKRSGSDFLDERGFLKPLPIETMQKPNADKIIEEARKYTGSPKEAEYVITENLDGLGLSTDGNLKEKAARLAEATSEYTAMYPNFTRRIAQMYWDGLRGKPEREQFRRAMVQATEKAYQMNPAEIAKGDVAPFKAIMGREGTGKSISSIAGESRSFNVQTPIRKAEKTLASVNVSSACPMFTVSNSGCWGDACYVTSMARGGSNVNLYQSVAYTGEILQMDKASIDAMNSIGGLRINGIGDISIEVQSQIHDIIRHAKMRGLNLKVVTKQEDTYKVISNAKQKGIDISHVVVQPSFDFWLTPVEYGIGRKGSGLAEPSLGIKGAIAAGRTEPAGEAIRTAFGRETREIGGKLYYKSGFSIDQVNALRQKYPVVSDIPRAVLGTPKEIAETALRMPNVIFTLMHGKVSGGTISEFGDEILDFGMTRHLVTKSGGQWNFSAVKVSKKNERVPIKSSAHEKVNSYIKANYTPEEQEIIYTNLKRQTCCQIGAAKDACASCQGICATRSMVEHLNSGLPDKPIAGRSVPAVKKVSEKLPENIPISQVGKR